MTAKRGKSERIATKLRPWMLAARTRNLHPVAPKACHGLTFKPDRSIRADHLASWHMRRIV